MVTLTNPDGSTVEVSEEHAAWIESIRTGVAARAAMVEQADEDAARARGDLRAAARHRAERLRSLACARRYRASWKRVAPAPRAPQLVGVIDTRPARARARGAGRPARRPATRAASGDDGDGPPLPPSVRDWLATADLAAINAVAGPRAPHVQAAADEAASYSAPDDAARAFIRRVPGSEVWLTRSPGAGVRGLFMAPSEGGERS